MFQSFPAVRFFANPNLQPETSVGYDLGVEQALCSDVVRFGATYFHNNIKDLIDSKRRFHLVHEHRTRTLPTASRVSCRISRSSALARVWTTPTPRQSTKSPTPALLRRPKHKASLRNSWQATKQLSFDATILYVGSWIDGNRDFTNIAPLSAASFTTVNLAANYDFGDHVSVYGRINNLFDRKYQDPTGFLQPSLGAYAGVRVRF